MWLYRASGSTLYSDYLVSCIDNLNLGSETEFSWDNKYAGAELLFSGVRGLKSQRDEVHWVLIRPHLWPCHVTLGQDELAWAATWMYRATRDAAFSNYLVANSAWFQMADMNEFSWDNKYAGAEMHLATVRHTGTEDTSSSCFPLAQRCCTLRDVKSVSSRCSAKLVTMYKLSCA